MSRRTKSNSLTKRRRKINSSVSKFFFVHSFFDYFIIRFWMSNVLSACMVKGLFIHFSYASHVMDSSGTRVETPQLQSKSESQLLDPPLKV